MSSPNQIILLLEDCPVTACLVERVILHELPAARLIWARTVDEARERSAGLPISVFLIDIVLPDGSGLEFLEQAAVAHPSACAIVITATALPEYRVMSAALGALHFMEKPLDIPVLLGHIRDALGSQSTTGATRDFHATLENVTPMDILQLKCLSAASTVVEFRSYSGEGCIRFQKGEVVDALAGSLRGIDAVREIISWPHGQVFEHAEIGEFERTIHCSWQALLMEAAQAIDEQDARTSAA
jgi:DNA-binding NarL/FixJ family response regulator